ncbi:hypothetical protein [Opitutus sp. ER46]|uniref:hypothetical protein n=1 Tax=Opitutus sp. ER46 TaxID=2161864 RepID=UPI000D31C080|nr:hypothetical protein [Opitutus sp. ER46]PTX98993.1 hypothetical protein DB354_02950 [Opitutus sp. ER46]
MKLRFVLGLLVACLVVSGCESVSSVRERIAARNEPRRHTFSAPPRVVFDAVKQAATAMGYRMTRGGPAQGEFDGVTGVDIGESAGSSRQVTIRVRLKATLDETGTEASVRFTEIVESDSSNRMGMATETTMRDTPQYEVFFRKVQQALDARPAAQRVQPPAASTP